MSTTQNRLQRLHALRFESSAGMPRCMEHCMHMQRVVSNVRLCSSSGRFALSCSIILWLSGGSFVRKVLSGSQALLERVVSVRLAPLESYRCVICEEKLGCDRSRASARYQRQPARNVLQSLPWRLLSLAETSVVCAGPACRGRLRCMLF